MALPDRLNCSLRPTSRAGGAACFGFAWFHQTRRCSGVQRQYDSHVKRRAGWSSLTGPSKACRNRAPAAWGRAMDLQDDWENRRERKRRRLEQKEARQQRWEARQRAALQPANGGGGPQAAAAGGAGAVSAVQRLPGQPVLPARQAGRGRGLPTGRRPLRPPPPDSDYEWFVEFVSEKLPSPAPAAAGAPALPARPWPLAPGAPAGAPRLPGAGCPLPRRRTVVMMTCVRRQKSCRRPEQRLLSSRQVGGIRRQQVACVSFSCQTLSQS